MKDTAQCITTPKLNFQATARINKFQNLATEKLPHALGLVHIIHMY